MDKAIKELGKPQLVEMDDKEPEQGSYAKWKYPDSGVEKVFWWYGGRTSCYYETYNIPVSKKGVEDRIKRLHKEHPAWTLQECRSVAERKIAPGMLPEHVLEAWGDPKHVNKTIGPGEVSEQWVYHKAYVYFSKGRTTTIRKND